MNTPLASNAAAEVRGSGQGGVFPAAHDVRTAAANMLATIFGKTRWDERGVFRVALKHVFLAVARQLGFAARYVSGYLMMDDRIDQAAMHAWVDVWVDGLGFVGFDVSNGISPDERYVRIATGLDYRGAAPIAGTRYGSGQEFLDVALSVAHQQQ